MRVATFYELPGNLLQSVDEHFSFLYEELLRFQEEASYKDNDPLNAENLPPVLAELGIGCSQREIDFMLKVLASKHITIVGALTQKATQHRIELIKNVYRNNEGKEPSNSEIIASIAATAHTTNDADATQETKSQIVVFKAWDTMKKSLKETKTR